MKNTALFYDTFETPAGNFSVAVNEAGAIALAVFGGDEVLRRYLKGREAVRNPGALAPLRKQVDAYFAGSRKPFVFKLAVEYTEFQKKVWDALCKIPHGETRTYGELAKMLGNPKASRAVGRANGSNPVSLFVPCHRVIGADGSLTGYAHGTEVKKKLLDLEGRRVA
jgi:methylated-DNA-[protein]-cysteine S-methyltransferase